MLLGDVGAFWSMEHASLFFVPRQSQFTHFRMLPGSDSAAYVC